MWSAVTTTLANSLGGRNVAGVTRVPSLIRFVVAARPTMVAHASRAAPGVEWKDV
jgi:hypothetical protein